MIYFRTTALATGLCAVLANCAPQIETAPISAALEPAEPQLAAVGDTWVSTDGTSERVSVVTAVDGDVVSGISNPSGCEWKFVNAGWGPSLEWKNCNGESGSRELQRDGSIWPMAVGSKVRWIEVKGQNSKGDTWTGEHNCEVLGTARVTAPVGTYDTYHVQCIRGSRTQDRYYAPEIGASVISRNRNSRNGDDKTWRLISFTPGAQT